MNLSNRLTYCDFCDKETGGTTYCIRCKHMKALPLPSELIQEYEDTVQGQKVIIKRYKAAAYEERKGIPCNPKSLQLIMKEKSVWEM